MIVEEIYRNLAQHMVEGIMTHAKLADFYGFLGFDGYQKCHEYHYISENLSYRQVNNYFIHHYNRLIQDGQFNVSKIVPDQWYQHNRSDVSSETKKVSLQSGIEAWVKWERSSKKTYETLYYELLQLKEIAAAGMVKILIQDVDGELAIAEQEWIKIKSLEYNVNDIMLEQDNILKKYKNKIKEIKYD